MPQRKPHGVAKMIISDKNQALIRYVGIAVFLCATWSLLAGAINLANDTSPTLAEKIINIPAAAAISLGGGMMFYYSKQTHFFESLFIMSFGLVLFCAEVNTQFGSYALSDNSYKQSSFESLKENKRMALNEAKLKQFDSVNIDSAALIAERSRLESELANKKEAAAINCKYKKCKAEQLAGSGEIESKIKLINSQLELADKKDKAFNKTESLLNDSASGKEDYKKLHPHFIATSELMYDTPKKAENARIILRLVQSFAVVLLSYIGLRMAYYNSPIQSTGNFKTRLKNGLNAIQSSFKPSQSKVERSEPSMTMLRTGTDDLPFSNQNEPKRGYGEVLNFPNRNVTTATKHVSPALQPKNDLSNAPVMDDSKHATITHPLNVPVMIADKQPTKQVASALHNPNALVKTVINQATMGRLICEYCNVDVPRKTHNQRFCCENCRIKSWEQKNGKSFKKGRVANS